jgi:integrase
MKNTEEKSSYRWLPTKNISTQIRYRSYLQHLQFFNEMRVRDIEPDHIDKWITQLKKPEYLAQGNSTRCDYKHEASILRIILNYYSSRINRSYRLPFLPDHRDMLKVKEKPTMKKDLTIEQFRSFLSELKKLCWDKKWEAVYFLAIMQYAIYGRVQDAAALYVEDFDLTNNRLEIKRKVQWLRAKNYKNQIVPGSKTNGGKSFSPIPELALQILKEWMLRSGVRSGQLFQIDGEIITYRTIQQKYDRALKNAKLPFTSTHILRHAALVEAYNSCQDILAVQRLAGHSDLRATERYAKVRDNRVAEVQRKMDKNLSQVWKK